MSDGVVDETVFESSREFQGTEIAVDSTMRKVSSYLGYSHLSLMNNLT